MKLDCGCTLERGYCAPGFVRGLKVGKYNERRSSLRLILVDPACSIHASNPWPHQLRRSANAALASRGLPPLPEAK